jgi:UDP-glucose 4-epimerase
MQKTILITGGAGFIGSHTAQALLARDYTVRVLDNLSNGQIANLPAQALADGRLEWIEGDVRDSAVVDQAVAGCCAVMHLAAQVSVQLSIAEPVDSSSHNVTGFLNVLDAVRRHKVPRLAYASSAAVYGTPAVLPLTESVSPKPLSPYGLEKYFNDQYAALYRDLYGTSLMGLRYFNVYGPRQDPRSPYAGVISKFADLIATGRPLRVFGDGLQTRDFVYVGDVAQVNALALTSSAQGVLNVGTGHSVTLLELVQAMSQAFEATANVVHEPPAHGDIRESAMQPARLGDLLGFVPATSLVAGLRELRASLPTT